MKCACITFAKCFAASVVLLGSIATLAQQPTLITTTAPGGMAPNGIGVTTSELLFSQPYCDGVQPRGVYQATNFVSGGAGVLDATMTELFSLPVQSGCSATQGAENYFVISPGLGGFTLNAVYATSPGSSTTDNVYVNGSLFISGILDDAPGHAGITFDSIGSFSNALIVTTPNAVYGFNSSGTQIFTYPTPNNGEFESATVAPLTNSACPGCLYVTGDESGAPGVIYTVAPGTASGTVPTLLATLPGSAPSEPEGIQFITPTSCTLTGTDFSYFVSGYASGGQIESGAATNGALLAYTNTQIAPFAGMALIPIEVGGSILAFDPTTKAFSTFSTPVDTSGNQFQMEGNTLVACAPASGGCPATQGYWKHHQIATPTLTIGGVTYTDAQLVNILNTAPKGGDATLILVHQLIAALANEAAGAKHIGIVEDGMSVDTAIADANLLLSSGLPQAGFPGSNPGGVVFPINLNNATGTFVQSGTTLGGYFTTLSNVLNDYNSATGLGCSEASGLI